MAERYPTLDAMRGVAAIVVVIYHSAVITDAACTQATCNVRIGYLAVDLFFALSGFVLSHAYDPRFATGMSAWIFMKERLVRLLPIYWLALLVSLPLVAIDFTKGGVSLTTVVSTAVLNAVVLPWNSGATYPYAVAFLRPAWSLFFELWVANLVFALFWRQLRGINLAIVIGLSLAGVVIGSYSYGNLDIGPVWRTFPGGFPRALFSFFLGVALRRLSTGMSLPALAPVAIVAAALVTFFMPVSAAWLHCAELTCVVLVYPALILIGSGAGTRPVAFAKTLGDASYPLYLIHIPMLDYIVRAMHRFGIAPHPAIAGLFVVAAVSVAIAISRYYDAPARNRLSALLDRPQRRYPKQGVASTPDPAGLVHANAIALTPILTGQP